MASFRNRQGAVVAQSLFNTATVKRPWQSYASSTILHIAMLIAIFLIAWPAIEEVVEPNKPLERVILVAPKLPEYQPKIPPPSHVVVKLPVPKPVVKPVEPPKVAQIKPPVPVPPKKVQIAAAPEVKNVPTPIVRDEPMPKLTPAPPRPAVRTGVFQTEEAAKGVRAQNDVKVGGFGDPNGVPPSPNSRPAPVMLAQVGSFDAAVGSGTAGGGGKATLGGVRDAGFGSPTGTGTRSARGAVRDAGFGNGTGGGNSSGGGGQRSTGVQSAGFGDNSVARQPMAQAAVKPAEPSTTPVEIISKPTPAYTPEARELRLEGQVALEVVFLANGGIHVVRVVHGLGHGLDESAERAALAVKFKPATKAGIPVDSNATIRITFQLT